MGKMFFVTGCLVVKLGRCVSNAIGTLLTGVEKLNQWRKIKVMLMILAAQALVRHQLLV